MRCCLCATQAVPIAANKTLRLCHTCKRCPLQDGMPCRNPVNIDTCPYCDYHVGSEFKKVHSKRGQFAESKLHSAFKQQGGKGQSGGSTFKHSASRAARVRQGVSRQLRVLPHLLLSLQPQQACIPTHALDGYSATSTTRLWLHIMRHLTCS